MYFLLMGRALHVRAALAAASSRGAGVCYWREAFKAYEVLKLSAPISLKEPQSPRARRVNLARGDCGSQELRNANGLAEHICRDTSVPT